MKLTRFLTSGLSNQGGSTYWRKQMYGRKLDYLHITLIGLIIFMFLGMLMMYSDSQNDIRGFKTVVNDFRQELQEARSHNTLLQGTNSRLMDHISELESIETRSRDDIKNYITTNYKNTPKTVADQIADLIIKKSTEHNVPVVSIVGVMQVESQFNPYLVSTAGARGTMQVMFRVHGKNLKKLNGIENKYELHDIGMGIDSGIRVLRGYLTDSKNDMEKALYKYIGGPNPMKKGWRKPTSKQKAYSEDVFAAMGQFAMYRSFASLREIEKPEVAYVEPVAPVQFLHKIRYQGESLSLIAKWYTGKTGKWKAIAAANPEVIPERMKIDQIIYIPDNLLKNRTPMPKNFVDDNRPRRKKTPKVRLVLPNPEVEIKIYDPVETPKGEIEIEPISKMYNY